MRNRKLNRRDDRRRNDKKIVQTFNETKCNIKLYNKLKCIQASNNEKIIYENIKNINKYILQLIYIHTRVYII